MNLIHRTKPLRSIVTLAIAALAFESTACVKSRSQIRGDNPSEEDETPTMANSKNSASSRYELEEIRNEVRRVSGRVEEIDHQSRAQGANEARELAQKFEGRIAELEKNQILILSELKGLKDRPGERSDKKESNAPSEDLLSAGFDLLEDKNFDAAAEKFRSAIAKGLKGKNASEAHFGLGESEYGLKNYKKAIVQYSKVQELWPKSARIPQSLYKIGISFLYLNMKKEANGFFAELVERYPKSVEAKKARSKIKE